MVKGLTKYEYRGTNGLRVGFSATVPLRLFISQDT